MDSLLQEAPQRYWKSFNELWYPQNPNYYEEDDEDDEPDYEPGELEVE